jgi:hypothetical protein
MIIDMQENFLDNFDLETKERMINEQIKVIDKLKEIDSPIINLEYFGNGKIEPRIKNAFRGYFPYPFNSILKYNNDCFSVFYLNPLLKILKTKKIVCMGVTASACLKQTIESAIKKGYEVISSKTIIGEPIHYKTEEELKEDFEKIKELNKGRIKEFSKMSSIGIVNYNILEWYKKNSTFFDNSKELLDYIQECSC